MSSLSVGIPLFLLKTSFPEAHVMGAIKPQLLLPTAPQTPACWPTSLPLAKTILQPL